MLMLTLYMLLVSEKFHSQANEYKNEYMIN